ncbi:MAG: diacylglycerol kinase [Magnetococcales bacterium]|nr:diacylglycerol kinase [Magnetococcales bacterium]
MSEYKLDGATHFIKAFFWSMAGFKAAWRHEAAFRQEVIALVVMVPLGVWLGEGAVQKALLVASVLFVIVVELLNSAMEATVDRIGLEHHILSGRAKDLGSAAVFVALTITGVIWGFILFAKL